MTLNTVSLYWFIKDFLCCLPVTSHFPPRPPCCRWQPLCHAPGVEAIQTPGKIGSLKLAEAVWSLGVLLGFWWLWMETTAKHVGLCVFFSLTKTTERFPTLGTYLMNQIILVAKWIFSCWSMWHILSKYHSEHHVCRLKPDLQIYKTKRLLIIF